MSKGPPPAEWFADGTIAPRKTDGYLLSPTHPLGCHKARLWDSVFGLGEGEGKLLEKLIREQLQQAEPVERGRTKVSQRWELVIPRFRGPNGNVGPVLTAWALDFGKSRPHLTTAYPIVNS